MKPVIDILEARIAAAMNAAAAGAEWIISGVTEGCRDAVGAEAIDARASIIDETLPASIVTRLRGQEKDDGNQICS